MRLRKLVPTLIATGLLFAGIGVTVAIADDNAPATTPEACVVVTPANTAANTADAVSNAGDDVSQEAQSQQADDQQGDVQDGQSGDQGQSGEQGDCNNQDDGDQGNG